MVSDVSKSEILGLTATIVAAFVANNTVQTPDMSELIRTVHAALVATAGKAAAQHRDDLKPAIPVKKSVTPDYLVCLEDGKKFKSLKRHLRSHYNLSPEQYREKWSLPPDYPMVAPNYAEARSQLAKKMGLGTRRDK
jgi:predicted transcriptional regulator